MRKRVNNIFIILVLLLVLVPVGSFGAHEFGRWRLQKGFDEIKFGDSSEKVKELMGSPDTVEPCFNEPNCTSLYYGVLFERWIIYVDANDHVTDKINNVGLF